jgi:prolyl oligopeptidase
MAHTSNAPPPTHVEPVTEFLHGVEVTDPYRWLEDQDSPRTRKWIEEQTAYTRRYFEALSFRGQIKARVEELLAQKESVSDLWNAGERYFFMRRHSAGEQPNIVVKDGLSGEERVVVDPAQRGTGNSTAVSIIAVSHNGRLLAYSVRQGGTDSAAVEIIDVDHGSILADNLPNGSCTGFVFASDDSGFFYSHSEAGHAHPNIRAAFWHRFGTERSEDQQQFFAGEDPSLILGMIESSEAHLLGYCIVVAGKHPVVSLYLQDFAPNATPTLFLENIQGCFVPFFIGGELLAYTNVGAPNFRIVRIDRTEPRRRCWRDIVAESDRRIQQFAVAGGRIFVARADHFSTEVTVFRLDDCQKEEISFPRNGTINFLNKTMLASELLYSYTSIYEPPSVSVFGVREDNVQIWDEANSVLDPSIVSSEQVTFLSKDGTAIPLLLAARKDLLHSGPLPTFLTGYGGFGICVTPRFTAYAAFLIEQGFLLAVPAQRGGSELGNAWHIAGKGQNRQNSFDDFIAAAEWLLLQGRSARGRIAIGGASNAGLLVGVAMTQRPDLFRAAISLGPLLDMTRYHLFGFAAGWSDEYGSPDDERDFYSLFAYSPYHHVRDGERYPAVLLISGDADARCNPLHARKMTARLQSANSSEHPILMDYSATWGHTPVQPRSIRIEALTDRLAFLCHELGVHIQPVRSK